VENHLRCVRAHSDRLGSDGGEGLGRDGGEGGDCVSTSELRVGSRNSKDMLEYEVDSCESGNDEWTVGIKVAAMIGSGLALLARMSFDKDNPVDQE
jgi:hypothetical protein